MRRATKLLGMLASAALMCAGNLCINASKREGQIPYLSVTVTFLIEVLKLLVCLAAIVVLRVPPPARVTLKESASYAVPSLLYMVDNNLTYVILRYIDPATLSVLWNLKILTTAVLVRVVLKRRLSELRVIAIVLLLLGVVTSQSDHIQKQTTHAAPSAPASAPTEAPAPASGGASAAAGGAKPHEIMLALLLVLTAVTISSCASVFTEWAFKRKDAASSFLWQNAQLYVFGILFNALGLLVEAEQIAARGFFDGYNGWTVAVVFVNCVAGISVGLILKFLDNIAGVYAHAVAMMLTMLVSMLFFRFSPSLEFVCGLGVLLVSMYLYHHKLGGGGGGTTAAAASPTGMTTTTTTTCSHCSSTASTPSSSSSSSSSSSTAINGHASTALSLSAMGLHPTKKKLYEKLPSEIDEIELGHAARRPRGRSGSSSSSDD